MLRVTCRHTSFPSGASKSGRIMKWANRAVVPPFWAPTTMAWGKHRAPPEAHSRRRGLLLPVVSSWVQQHWGGVLNVNGTPVPVVAPPSPTLAREVPFAAGMVGPDGRGASQSHRRPKWVALAGPQGAGLVISRPSVDAAAAAAARLPCSLACTLCGAKMNAARSRALATRIAGAAGVGPRARVVRSGVSLFPWIAGLSMRPDSRALGEIGSLGGALWQ